MKKNNQFLRTFDETETWLKDIGIKNYTINDDLTVDVNGHVNLDKKKLEFMPIQFGIVNGNFDCRRNKLTSLEGCPSLITGFFSCFDNKLINLQFAPLEVQDSFYCSHNQITTLENFLAKIGAVFYCDNNPITNLNYLNFDVKENIYFTPTDDMNYLDKYKDQDGDVDINFNDLKKIQTLKNLNEKLNDDLPINTNMIKKMKV